MEQRHNNGVTAELFAAYKLSQKGFEIYFPFLTQSKCDLLIGDGETLKKVQVKKATKCSANGHEFIQIRLDGHGRTSYEDGDFDLLAMVFEERMWVFPWSFVRGKTSMSFSIFEPRGAPATRPRRDISMYEVL